jgi:Spy/CpxP family protein refolding chaperone
LDFFISFGNEFSATLEKCVLKVFHQTRSSYCPLILFLGQKFLPAFVQLFPHLCYNPYDSTQLKKCSTVLTKEMTMAFIPTEKNPFRYYPGRKSGLILLSMMFALSGCAHEGKNTTAEKRSHESSKQGSESPHATQNSEKRSHDFYKHESESPHATQGYGDPHHFSSSMEKELMLSDEQKEAFHRLRLDYDKMVVNKTADVRMAEVDLATLLGKDELDREAIEAQVKTIGAIKEEMMMARIDSLLELKGVLTEEQYTKFREILRKRMNQVEGHSPHGSM